MKTYAIRLNPGDDLKQELIKHSKDNNIKAGCILACVGSLDTANIRVADGKTEKKFDGKFEILSLVGTIGVDDLHIHIAFLDDQGNVYGGHLKEGCEIHTTAEIVIGQLEELVFAREPDQLTGYKELKIRAA